MAASSSTPVTQEARLVRISNDNLAERLEKHSAATDISISGSLTATHLETIGRHLSTNTSLTCLRLSSLEIHQPCPEFTQSIQSSSTLQILRIYTANFSDKDVELCSSLTASSSLTNLGINISTVDPSCVAAMSRSLATNSTLTHLSLSEANIEDTGAKALAHALRFNSDLQSLNLEGNNLTDIAGGDLAHALDYNASIPRPLPRLLTTTDLPSNSTLQSLNLEANPLTSRTAIYFAYALRSNAILQMLNLNNDTVPQTNRAYPSIQGKLERNTWNTHQKNVTLFGILMRELTIAPLMEDYKHLKKTYSALKKELDLPSRAKSQRQRTRELRNRNQLIEKFEGTRQKLFNTLTLLKKALPDIDPRKRKIILRLSRLGFSSTPTLTFSMRQR
jgi:hypothetical protein